MHLHVHIAEGWRKSATRYGLTEEELRDRFLAPRELGEPIWVDGEEFTWDKAKLEVYEGPPTDEIEPALGVEWLTVVTKGVNVTDRYVSRPPGVLTREPKGSEDGPDPRRVVVIHGRDDEARQAVFEFLRDVDLRPMEWEQLVTETGSAAPFVGDVVHSAFAIAQAAVVVFTPDDEARLHDDLHRRDETGASAEPEFEARLTGQPRPNVIFEAGMALVSHPDQTVILEIGALRPISDLAGRHTVRVGADPASLQALASRLRAAGCPVDTSGSDWLNTARFSRLAARKRRPRSQLPASIGRN